MDVEQPVSRSRRGGREEENERSNVQYLQRQLTVRYEADGPVLHARLPAEQGALVMKALELARERAWAEADKEAPAEPGDAADVAAETRAAGPLPVRQADALVDLPESYLESDHSPASGGDRYQGVLHASAETSDDNDDESDRSHLQDGPRVSAETSRRSACDCSRVEIFEDRVGELLSIGRKSRAIPPSIRRTLKARDGGCRFPGCTHRRFVDGHHIVHWADGGETGLDNLVLLCRHHHWLVHEGGFTCERLPGGKLVFRDPCRRELPRGSDLLFNNSDNRATRH